MNDAAMRVSNSDITKSLVAELKSLRERHLQFRTRVKEADRAARIRDDTARKHNEALTQRVISLEHNLREAKDSIKVLSGPFIVGSRLTDWFRRFASFVNCYPP